MEVAMKREEARVVAATAEPVTGSPSGRFGGADISALYIDMLCERFKNRGIKTGVADAKRSAEIEKSARALGIELGEKKVDHENYKTMKIDGRSYMSHDDFAAYYKDLRGYKLPKFYSRAEKEYLEAEAGANVVQESGKPPKKVLWLAIIKRVKCLIKSFFSEFVVAEFRQQTDEVREGKKTRMPRGFLTVCAVVTLSLLMIVCSSVMVSRALREVSILENKIEKLEDIRDDLMTDLEVKNNMLFIKETAVEEYGMISGDYAASRYVDLTEDEKIELYEEETAEESLLSQLLRAVGLKKD